MIKTPLCSWVQKCSAGHIGIVWEVLPASITSGCSSAEPAPPSQVRGVSSPLMCHNCKPRHEAALGDNLNIKHQRVCSMALPTKREKKTVLFIPDSNGDLLLSTHQAPRGSIPCSVPQDGKQSKSKLDTLHSMKPCLLTTAGSKIAAIPLTLVSHLMNTLGRKSGWV